jgi:hypothetical protein
MSCCLNSITVLPSRKEGLVFTEHKGGWAIERVWTEWRRDNPSLNPYSLDVRPACGPVVIPINLSGSNISFTVRIWNKHGILIITTELNWTELNLLGYVNFILEGRELTSRFYILMFLIIHCLRYISKRVTYLNGCRNFNLYCNEPVISEERFMNVWHVALGQPVYIWEVQNIFRFRSHRNACYRSGWLER